jgi:hypothetical protein
VTTESVRALVVKEIQKAVPNATRLVRPGNVVQEKPRLRNAAQPSKAKVEMPLAVRSVQATRTNGKIAVLDPIDLP